METTFTGTDVTGKNVQAGDLVMYSSGSSQALLLGYVTHVRPRNFNLVSIHGDEAPYGGHDIRRHNQVIKMVGPEYDNVPVEWLKTMFPAVS